MGNRYNMWIPRSEIAALNLEQISEIIQKNRNFAPCQSLEYGDHGLVDVLNAVSSAIKENKRIGLYADYDVDGTMSCVSWIWFFDAIGFKNYTHYIPDRFSEGYGVNLNAIKHLYENEKIQMIITMDTGITANQEALWCKEHGIQFICTDHHKIQAEKMPDCLILNPKNHPSPMYQELCGCGITFVLLRKLAKQFSVPNDLWNDLLAIAGMATICDVVPLNPVNHKIAQMGVGALLKSKRPVLKKLFEASAVDLNKLDEQDIGFRLGPKINAVGRLDHANKVIEAFLRNDPADLVNFMTKCNEDRKNIQSHMVIQATKLAEEEENFPVLFLGDDSWHQGVVGICASKIAETFWKPTWLFQIKDNLGKGSARSIPGFDVTEAMMSCGHLFEKFGGHQAAGGFSFSLDKLDEIKASLVQFAQNKKSLAPNIWESKIYYDCFLPSSLLSLELVKILKKFRPFGNEFFEPIFEIHGKITKIDFLLNKQTKVPAHTKVSVKSEGKTLQILFFHLVIEDFAIEALCAFLVKVNSQKWLDRETISIIGSDWKLFH